MEGYFYMYDKEKKILSIIYNSSIEYLAHNMGFSNEEELDKHIKRICRKAYMNKQNNTYDYYRDELRLIRTI